MENVSNHPELELDPTSDRYRICPHPNCKKPHMARNRGKDYCCRQHADDHYNMLRRLKRQAEIDRVARTLLAEEAHALLREEESKQSTETNPLVENDAHEEQELEHVESDPIPAPAASLERNLEILSSLQLDPVHGSIFKINRLVELGFNFSRYTAAVPNHNLPTNTVSNYIAYGPFRAYLVTSESLLVINKP